MEDKEHKPILSDDLLQEMWVFGIGKTANMELVRDFYEARITSNELVVRNKCAECGNLWTPSFITKSTCPGCGSKIIEW